ncbi:MAG: DUF2191 domain-containing protein [Alphaproteobacteria bacterium]|nr:DUF2191 domain-containing protein [Alphaproteobacteria bacterium]
MKTTIDIGDALLEAARQLADREGTTVKALVEAGLRRVIDEEARREPFKLRRASFKGKGLQPDAEGLGWERLRALAYEGRGG